MSPVLTVVAVASTATFVAVGMAQVSRPRRRLPGRVRPYASPGLSRLGRPVVPPPVAHTTSTTVGLRQRLVGLLHGAVPDPALQTRLAQSGRYDVSPSALIGEHRVRQLFAALIGVGIGLGVGAAVGLPPLAVVGLAAGVGFAQALRPTAAVDRAIDERRADLRTQLPPLCQLLALRLRAQGSLVSSLAATLARTQGALAEELRESLAQHRAGRPLDQSLEAAAADTPEPDAARLYRMLAGALRHGGDAVPELLRLARESREQQLTRARRDATRKRAAVLLPTIGLLAPLMLLFIAAPLPGLVLGL